MSELKRYSYQIWPQYAAFQGSLVEDRDGALIKSSEFDKWKASEPQSECVSIERYAELENEINSLKEWVALAFEVHPNIDVDIENLQQ